MDYFRKTKFRESSLVIILLVIGVIYFTSRDTPAKEETDVQALIDAAVEQAVEEALSTTSDEYTDKTDNSSTSTKPPVLAVPVGNYWGQYNDGTWAIVLSSEKPENFEWAWDVFNREEPSGAYGFDEFDENSTLIGTLVDFDCSFNRISKTEAHKEAFGVDENTIEYYDTYLEWAQDNYPSLTKETVLIISKIMRGVWTCDYAYLESISPDYLEYINPGDAYVEPPTFAEYISSYEDNFDDDHQYGKFTYTLGALLYMNDPSAMSITGLCNEAEVTNYWWPRWKKPQEMSNKELAKWAMFDNGLTKGLLDGTYQGDTNWYGRRLKITNTGVWNHYFPFAPFRLNPEWVNLYYGKVCIDPDYYDLQTKANEARSSESAYYGEVNTYQHSNYIVFEQASNALIKDARIIEGASFDSFVIELVKEVENDLLPGPFSISLCSNSTCTTTDTDEMGFKVPPGFEEAWLAIEIRALAVKGWQYNGPPDEIIYNNRNPITSPNSNLVGLFNGQPYESISYFVLGIEPGSTFRSYRTANPPSLVIEVDK